jgi:hypothetical protein
VALVFAACGDEPRSQGAASPPSARWDIAEGPSSKEKIEDFAEVRLPPRAEGLESWARRSIDTSLSFRLEMSRAQFEAFYDSGAFTQELIKGERPSISDQGHFDWRLDAVGEPWGHTELVDGFSRSILVDFEDPDRPVVYMTASTT